MGNFQLARIFFFCSLPVQEFFFRVKPSARICFCFESFVQTNLPFLHGTIGGSWNISLSNNPVFLGEHFTRVVLLEAIGLRGFRCYPRVICRVDTTAFASSYLAHVYCEICFKLSKY